jgi:hypothetical protein
MRPAEPFLVSRVTLRPECCGLFAQGGWFGHARWDLPLTLTLSPLERGEGTASGESGRLRTCAARSPLPASGERVRVRGKSQRNAHRKPPNPHQNPKSMNESELR